jgi:hypothetical protein
MTKKRIYIGIGCALAMATLFYSCRGDDVPEIADIDTAATENAVADLAVNVPETQIALAKPESSETLPPVDVTAGVESLMNVLDKLYQSISGKNLERRSIFAMRMRYEFRVWLNSLSESDRRLYLTLFSGEPVTDPEARKRRDGLRDELEGLVNKVLADLSQKGK